MAVNLNRCEPEITQSQQSKKTDSFIMKKPVIDIAPALLLNYFKIALRKIRRQKGYTIINISGLSVGLACCAIMMLWVRNEKSFDRFHINRDSIYRLIKETRTNGKVTFDARIPYPLAETILGKIPEVKNYTRYQGVDGWKISYGDRFFFNDFLSTGDSTFFEIFTFPFVKGDPKTALKNRYSIVVTERMARKYFGTEEPMGKVLTINGRMDAFTVTGVIKDVPGNSHLHFDCIIPIVNFWEFWDGRQDGWGMIMFYTYIQLRPNSSPVSVGPKIAAVLNYNVPAQKAGIMMQPLMDVHLKSTFGWDLDNFEQGSQSTLTIFTLAALVVLILAIINFTNLATARSASRAKEVGLRKINGAGRAEIIGQFLGESVVISFLALLLALVLVYFGLPFFNNLAGKHIEYGKLFELQLILALLAVTLITGVLSGSYPSFFLSSFQPARVLKGEIISGGQSQAVIRKTLVVVQFALTLFLIIGSAIVNRQLKYIRGKDLGIDTRNILNTFVMFRDYQSAKSIFLNNPDIISITLSDPPSIDQRGFSNVTWEGKNIGTEIQFFPVAVDPDYIKTFRVKMASGRFFSDEFPTDRTEALVLNETAARAMNLISPVGKKITIGKQTYSVIGIIKDFHQTTLRKYIEPMILYCPRINFSLCLRINPARTKETISFIEKTVIDYYPDSNRPFRYEMLDERIGKFYSSENKVEAILNLFTVIALFTACLGLLGLASFMAEKRTRKIGLRKIFGAPVSGMGWLQTWDFSKLILLSGVIAGPIAYWAAKNWLNGFAYHLNPGIGILLVTLSATLIIALVAVGYQSLKAAMTNPIDSLRHE
jgi:putative ABC transport system permease protein